MPTAQHAGAMLLLDAALDALAVLAPVSCAGCGRDDRAVCSHCRAALAPAPAETAVGTLRVASGLRYEGVARDVLLALKEHGRTDAAGPLGGALASALETVVRGEVELIPVPSSRGAMRRRGYDPVAVILRKAGVRRYSRELVSVRRTRQQKSLDSDARALNLRGSMRARHPLHGRRFVLVDDVLTTGATLLEAARAVVDAGGEVVAAATVAATPKRLGDTPGSSRTPASPRPGSRDIGVPGV